MAIAKMYTADGTTKSEIELPAKSFEADVSKACVYLTVNAYLANQRQGTSKSKSRSEINGTGAKPWKQKGTGRARAGTNSSPIWVRGNKAHGPKPRSYDKKVNKKVKRIAFLSALTAKAQANAVSVFESLSFETAKTTAFLKAINNSGLERKNVLFVVSPKDENAYVCAKNVPWARVMRIQDLNTYEVVRARNVVFSQSALESLQGGEG